MPPIMQLSKRALSLAESATLRVTRKVHELRAAGREIIDFGAGEPDFPSPPAAVRAAIRGLEDGFTRYTVAAGIPDLRDALARRYRDDFGSPWERLETLISVGAKAALLELILALVDEGSEVVVPTPAWVSFEEQICLAGGRPVMVPTTAADGFAIRADAVLEALGDATRMVLINSPCNPTGGRIEAADLRRIAEACAERQIILLSDETYERFLYDGRSPVSAASLAGEYPETIVVVGSFSKTYSMTGWRIGYALGPRALIGKAATIQGHATSNPTSFAMLGALGALEGAEDEVRRMITAMEGRRDYLMRRLAQLPGIECQPPSGAFYAFPQVSGWLGGTCSGSVDLAERWLEEAGVAVVPGIAFGADQHVRFSFACSRQTLAAGLDRLQELKPG